MKSIKVLMFFVMFCLWNVAFANLLPIFAEIRERSIQKQIEKDMHKASEKRIKLVNEFKDAENLTPGELNRFMELLHVKSIPGPECGSENYHSTTPLIPDTLRLGVLDFVVDVGQGCKSLEACYSRCESKVDCDRKFGEELRQACHHAELVLEFGDEELREKASLNDHDKSICYKIADTYKMFIEEFGDKRYDESCESR